MHGECLAQILVRDWIIERVRNAPSYVSNTHMRQEPGALESGEWSRAEVPTAEVGRAWKSEIRRECVGRATWSAVSYAFARAAMSAVTRLAMWVT
jgi:hypothetical protein